MEKIQITRAELGTIISANTPTRTMRAEYLHGTEWEDVELSEDWYVVLIETDGFGVLNIYCDPVALA